MPREVILLVDDDEPGRYVNARILRGAGYEVREAERGSEALALLAQERPDLLILDVKLPGMSGFEVLRQVRADPATAALPAMYLSATSADDAGVARGLAEGADAYLTKPVTAEVLLGQAQSLLRVGRMQKALRQSEARYHSLFTGMTEGFAVHEIICDAQGESVDFRFLDINPAFERLTGLTREQVVGRTHNEVLPDDSPHWVHVYGQVALTGDPVSFEHYSPALRRHYWVHAYRPAPGQFATLFLDVTPREEAEASLRESEARYRELVENANSAILRWRRDGTITFFNEYAQWFFGYSAEEAIGRHVSMLVPETESNGADLTALVQAVLEQPEAYTYNVNENVRRDGSRAWMAWTNKAILDADGQVAEVLAVGTDVTAQKEAADGLAQRNVVLQAVTRVFDSALHAEDEEELGEACLSVAQEVTGSRIGFVGELGADGLLHDIAISDPGWSACTMYDQSGHRRPPGNFAIVGLYGKVLAEGKAFFTNAPAAHPERRGLPEGHPPLTSFLGAPLLQGERVVGLLAVANRPGGYTDRQVYALEALAPAVVEALHRWRAEQALLAAERARAEIAENLSSEIAHRVRNNLAMVSGLLQMQQLHATEAATAQALGDALGRVRTFLELHERMFAARREDLDLSEVLREVARSAREALRPEGGAEVEVSGPSCPCSARTATNLSVIANELIVNALRYGDPGARGRRHVSVALAPSEAGLTLTVWNSGNPVPSGFDPSHQSGLGLHLVADLVAQYGGRLHLVPDRGGTRAEIFLPQSGLAVDRQPRWKELPMWPGGGS